MSSIDKKHNVTVEGKIPGAPSASAQRLRGRLSADIAEFITVHRKSDFQVEPFTLTARYGDQDVEESFRQPVPPAHPADKTGSRQDVDDIPEFVAIDPAYRLDQVILPDRTREALLDYVSSVELSPLVFGEWGLSEIEPHPSIAVNFTGPPGTGKTMASHAAAHYLGKKIMLSRVSDLESKYHGQGPKNLAGLFESAKAQDAVIFIDEAESLLSRRYAQPDHAAESAINSMRTELLMALDVFEGLVIFASNLANSYDVAIESRLHRVEFELPDRAARQLIWKRHLPARLPLERGCSAERLAEEDGVTGRDIKLAVISAAFRAARKGDPYIVTQESLIQALRQRKADSTARNGSQDSGGTIDKKLLADQMENKLTQQAAAEGAC